MSPVLDSSPSSSATTPTVEAALAPVAERLEDQHAAILDALRSDLLEPLWVVLDEAVEGHDKARRALDFDGAPTRRALWAAVRRYRQDTMASTWRPVRAMLSDWSPGARVEEQRQALRKRRDALKNEVPETIIRPEPEDLYAASATDGWGRRTLKALVRGGQVLKQRLRGVETNRQTVPLASLVAQHAATTLSDGQNAALDEVEQCIVRWTARLEREAMVWTHRLLEVERVLDRPDFHLNEVEVDRPPSSDDSTSGVMEADVDALLAEIRERATSLHQCLKDGRGLQLDDTAIAFSEAVETTMDRVQDAAHRAGSVFAERPSVPADRSEEAPSSPWCDWFDEVEQRLAFLDALATLRDDLTDRHAALVNELAAAGVAPIRSAEQETVAHLQGLRQDLGALLERPAEEEWDGLQAFDHEVDRGTDGLEHTLLSPLRGQTPRRTLETIVEAHRTALTSLVDDQPDAFVVHPPVSPDSDRVSPATDAHTLHWREGCRAVFDEVLFDVWRQALPPLLEVMDSVTDRAREVYAIVEFNLEAAREELQDLRAARQRGDADASFLEDARELAVTGLDRALDLLGEETEKLDRAMGLVVHRTWTGGTTVWTELYDRVRAAGQKRAHLLRLQGEIVRGGRWLVQEADRQARAVATRAKRTARKAQRQARRLVRLGHAAVGTEAGDEEALQDAIDALSSIEAVLEDLPIVYRRLFSFRPLQSPDLLIAREADRAAVDDHWDRWRRGLTDPLVFTGPAGSGRTSLLNTLRTTTFRPARRSSIELPERITSEETFAKKVGQGLGLDLEPGTDRSLDGVAEHLRHQSDPDQLRVCTIEHFEHVLKRTVGGMQLAARVLSFLAETAPQVLWVVTTTNAAWQLIEASQPAAAGLVTRHVLSPFERSELEDLILRRHQRSGLRLVFDPPDESTHPILARRVRAMDDEDRRQSLLRTEFFDHLHDASGQNVMLALFYWFRSVTLDDDHATLHVQPLSPIAFEGLDVLPLPHAFALKALLEHGTVTIDELAEVLNVSVDTSRSLLETLGSALIIAPADRIAGPGAFQFASIERETRYRIRPLLIHPVTRFLRTRNIAH